MDGEHDRIDLRAVRHELKLLRDTGDTELYENRGGLDCPGCGHEFHQVFASEKRMTRFDSDTPRPFCIARERDRVVVFVHERQPDR